MVNETRLCYDDIVHTMVMRMSDSKIKWGYCPNCVKNIPHFPIPQSRTARILNFATLGFANSLRLGPWYCVHCETMSFYLRKERIDAPRFRSADDETSSNADSNQLEESTAEPIGNFLKTDHSLVMRTSRLKRFSEKYRDSVVRRLFNGASTMLQIRQEKNISEIELVDWISDLVERMQARLDALEETVQQIPSVHLLGDQVTNSPTGSNPGGPIVEGKVKPK